MSTAFEDWARDRQGSPWSSLVPSLATACGLHPAYDAESEWTPFEDLGVTYDFENTDPFKAQAGDVLFMGSSVDRVPFAVVLDNVGTSLFLQRKGVANGGAIVGATSATLVPGVWIAGEDNVKVTGIARFALKNPAFFGYAAPPHQDDTPPTPPAPPEPPSDDRDDPPKPAPPTPAPPIRRPPTPKPGKTTPKPPAVTPARAGAELGAGMLLLVAAVGWALIRGGR